MYRTQLLKLPLQDCSSHLRFHLDPVIFPPANILLPGERCMWSLCKWSCTCLNSGTSKDIHVSSMLTLHRNKYWYCYGIHSVRAEHRSPKKQINACPGYATLLALLSFSCQRLLRQKDSISRQDFKYEIPKSTSSLFRHLREDAWFAKRLSDDLFGAVRRWELLRTWP